ncbi:hypothetical protein ACIBHX_14725 [Nonomuraea sp. NPDC050536]|uniref:hypothetical protein n=1 Tax=Nonomuraea sp. NPDC050536 TaxID=3364366 RepID=UPI0037C6C30D
MSDLLDQEVPASFADPVSAPAGGRWTGRASDSRCIGSAAELRERLAARVGVDSL